MTFVLPKSDVPGRWWKGGLVEGQWVDTYSEPLVKQAIRDALEHAAKACDDLAQKYRDLYKGRTEFNDRDHLYNPHTDGMSDGAHECEEAIRKLILEMV